MTEGRIKGLEYLLAQAHDLLSQHDSAHREREETGIYNPKETSPQGHSLPYLLGRIEGALNIHAQCDHCQRRKEEPKTIRYSQHVLVLCEDCREKLAKATDAESYGLGGLEDWLRT